MTYQSDETDWLSLFEFVDWIDNKWKRLEERSLEEIKKYIRNKVYIYLFINKGKVKIDTFISNCMITFENSYAVAPVFGFPSFDGIRYRSLYYNRFSNWKKEKWINTCRILLELALLDPETYYKENIHFHKG